MFSTRLQIGEVGNKYKKFLAVELKERNDKICIKQTKIKQIKFINPKPIVVKQIIVRIIEINSIQY